MPASYCCHDGSRTRLGTGCHVGHGRLCGRREPARGCAAAGARPRAEAAEGRGRGDFASAAHSLPCQHDRARALPTWPAGMERMTPFFHGEG